MFRGYKLYKLVLILVATSKLVFAQPKLFDSAMAIKLKDGKAKYNFSFVFNKVKGSATDPIYIYSSTITKNDGRGGRIHAWDFGIKPVFDANIGSDVEVSANNIVSSLLTEFQKAFTNGKYFIGEAGPVLAFDKNFNTGLIYGNVGGLFLKFKGKNDPTKKYPNRTHEIGANLNLHSGKRVFPQSDSIKSKGLFYRIVPGGYLSYQLNNSSSQPVIIFNLDIKGYTIFNDKTFKKNGIYPHISPSITYRFRQKNPSPSFSISDFGLILKYVYGFEEPTFKELNAVTLGISVYGLK